MIRIRSFRNRVISFLSEIYLHRQQLDSARYYLKKASVSTDDSEKLQAQYYKQLYQIAELKKDYQSALNHYKKYTTYITDYQLNKTEERIDNIVNRHPTKRNGNAKTAGWSASACYWSTVASFWLYFLYY